jgi:hypothetical protein
VSMALLLLTALMPVASAKEPGRQDRGARASLVGTWVIDTNVDDPSNPPDLLVASADGTLQETSCCDAPGAGQWRPTGHGTADATILFPAGDENGFIGFNTVRAAVELAADGQSFTATYTVDLPNRDGTSSGQLGPLTASATRVAVEAMGQPVGPVPQPPTPEASAAPEASSMPAASAAPEA